MKRPPVEEPALRRMPKGSLPSQEVSQVKFYVVQYATSATEDTPKKDPGREAGIPCVAICRNYEARRCWSFSFSFSF